VISIEQGLDPRDFSLLVYGGAGALVGATVARELEIPTMVIPIAPATFSALGMLTIDVVHDYSQTYITSLDQIEHDVLDGIYRDLMDRGSKALTRDGVNKAAWKFLPTAEMRYQGQEHTVNIPMPTDRLQDYDTENIRKLFGDVHFKQYGHKMDDPVEIVTLRLRSVGVLPRPEIPSLDVNESNTARERDANRLVYRSPEEGNIAYKIYKRNHLALDQLVTGPAIIEESSSTTILHAGDQAVVGVYGELVISPSST
jgi:N-methylhydantoinase A